MNALPDTYRIVEPMHMEVCPAKHDKMVLERQQVQAKRAPFQPYALGEVAIVDSRHGKHVIGASITRTESNGAPSVFERILEAVSCIATYASKECPNAPLRIWY